ncbi:helix-turn-helix transcriptional regulator [Allocatelliglobosispora scoriae]|uniref:helix-turn-helix transcriptional regulator n=1 Tax=Allocatelliglobosispora scoriae TaxID=643052 RepID=UPI0028A69642|nr:helix-turn-helix domain-containing protein [Allocatelliglobosispora scoriae]
MPELCEDLDITRSTYYDWRRTGKAPRSRRLPNGSIRIDRDVYEAWLDTLIEEDN